MEFGQYKWQFSRVPGGVFNNAGNVAVSYASLLTTFHNSGNVNVSPNGSLGVFRGSSSGTFDVGASAELLLAHQTLNTGTLITGTGTTRIELFGYSYEGPSKVTVAGDTTINTNLDNYATLVVQAGATLTLNGTFTHQRRASGEATTQLSGGTITSAKVLNFQSGSLVGSGTINGSVSNNGTISPGTSPGTITINGNVSLLSNSKLVMEIGGLTQGKQYDYLSVSGLVSLDGVLELHMPNDFEQQIDPDLVFTLFTSGDVLTGAFDNIANGGRLVTADGKASFQVNYGAGSLFDPDDLVLSDPHVVPEPVSLVLFIGGSMLVGLVSSRRR